MKKLFMSVAFAGLALAALSQSFSRQQTFNNDWTFHLGDASNASSILFNDAGWRKLDLPHDWSVELPFDKDSPAGTGGGALRGGTGWYRKAFVLPAALKGKRVAIRFDGVYRNSEVWINGNSLGKRPNGYITFEYDMSRYLKFGQEKNVLAVRVDNQDQPNSRWYSGSGIYRNVWLIVTDPVYIPAGGIFITTPSVSAGRATVNVTIRAEAPASANDVTAVTTIFDAAGNKVAGGTRLVPGSKEAMLQWSQLFIIQKPVRWSLEKPYLYTAETRLFKAGRLCDTIRTRFGIRDFRFDPDRGFFLNERAVKIRGVCNHHDLGCLGTAVHRTAIRRQLQILKDMGCNGIRTSHNPPAPELLDLCDEMGFIVMDEAFDMWKKEKTKYDYHLDWDEWHRMDLSDQVTRDRNHPSVFMWSVGNEIIEQWDKEEESAHVKQMITELVTTVKQLDPTRPVLTANNEVNQWNRILQANVVDITGYNYQHQGDRWLADSVFGRWGRKPFIVTESVSALATRGFYDMPSDSIRRWPQRWDQPLHDANPDLTCSAYDNCSTPWGSTHEETLRIFEKYPHISGMFIWTGFDYIGEPTPYPWPARSSYFGIIDLAGFPKDVYYLYQAEWTDKPVLHLFPHWNWKPGQTIDAWAYFSQADEVELFVNGKSQGVRKKSGEERHVSWRLTFEPGVIRAVSRKNGKMVLSREIHTAGAAAQVKPEIDNYSVVKRDDLLFVKIKVNDANGNLVPDAENNITFKVNGGTIAGVDNGSPVSMESFKANERKAFHGMCLVVIKPEAGRKVISVEAGSEGLKAGKLQVVMP